MYIPAKMMCMSNPTIASPARKPRMPPALRSCRSNSISSCLSSSLLMSRPQNRRGLRIVDRQQRPRLQVVKEVRQPEPAHGHRDHETDPVHDNPRVIAGLIKQEQTPNPNNDNENRN